MGYNFIKSGVIGNPPIEPSTNFVNSIFNFTFNDSDYSDDPYDLIASNITILPADSGSLLLKYDQNQNLPIIIGMNIANDNHEYIESELKQKLCKSFSNAFEKFIFNNNINNNIYSMTHNLRDKTLTLPSSIIVESIEDIITKAGMKLPAINID